MITANGNLMKSSVDSSWQNRFNAITDWSDRCWRFAVAMVILATVGASSGVAGDWFFFGRQRSSTPQHLPRYDYDHRSFPLAAPRESKATVLAVAASDPTRKESPLKPFHVRAKSLQAGDLQLDQIGLAIDRTTGRIIATGRVKHRANRPGTLGAHAEINVHAYVGHTAPIAPARRDAPGIITDDDVVLRSRDSIASPNRVDRLPPDAFCVSSFSNRIWVSRDQATVVSLVPNGESRDQDAKLKDHFDQITHLIVEFDYRKDR